MPKLLTLAALYFAQGLPFGFQATALPLLMRQRGASLATIGFASLLAAPWLFKALWAPLVDRYGSLRLGRRKSWILPMQAGLALSSLAAAHSESPRTLAGLVLLMNLFAATQDIAVDGLAVSWLSRSELGIGNAVQVVGYKLGMLTGGGLLVWLSEEIGISGLFYAVSGLMFAVLLLSCFVREDAVSSPLREPRITFARLFRLLGASLRRAETLAVVLVVATYKMGESMADAMWKPLLVDRGFSTSQVGLWSGTYGLLFSLFGSAAAGLLVRRDLVRTLLWVAAARAVSVGGEWWLSGQAAPTSSMVVAVTCFEHLAGGALTTVLFTLMMRRTERAIGGTHFTLLASIETLGKLPLGALSGLLAEQLGYKALFASATALCVAFVLLVYALRSPLSAETD